MAQKDTMFLVELVLEELVSYIDENHCYVTAQFADLFSLFLREPSIKQDKNLKKTKGRLKKAKSSASRGSRFCRASCLSRTPSPESKVEAGNSVLFESNVDSLIQRMSQYPIVISLYSRLVPDFKMGSGSVPWNKKIIDYLNNIKDLSIVEQEPVVVKDKYYIYHEFKSKRMATITLTIKLNNLDYGLGLPAQSPSIHDSRWLQSLKDFGSLPPQMSTITPNIEYPETGTIKTIYSGGKRKEKIFSNSRKTKIDRNILSEILPSPPASITNYTNNETAAVVKNIITFVRSETDIKVRRQNSLIKSQSASSINYNTRFDTLNYIFGDPNGSYGNGVYYVGYFTVQNVTVNSSPSQGSEGSPIKSSPAKSSSKGSPKDTPSKASSADDPPPEKAYLKFKICDSECQNPEDKVCKSEVSLDLPNAIGPYVKVSKCDTVVCEDKKYIREPLTPPDDRTLIDMTTGQKECCKIDEIVDLKAKLIFEKEPCFCSCECTFGFTKKTTYCAICGGFEVAGDEITNKSPDLSYPCPIYHKLAVNKTKSQPYATSDMKKKSNVDEIKSHKRIPGQVVTDKSIDSDKERDKERDRERDKERDKEKDKKEKKKALCKHILKDERFKFNYGYQAPKIGHSQCTFPCTGSLAPVPRNMGWLWTADNVPGLKYRPNWKPGAAHKVVVRLLKVARNPEQVLAKRRKKDPSKKKRPLKRPLLVVEKKDGEYTVTMETMKSYNKPRTLNQPPFEDKDPLTYTIGRTDEENKIRKMKKERKARRLEREQRDFIQKAFRNMCNDICMKTYRQALGLMSHSEDPICTCFPAIEDGRPTSVEHSCSCSDTLSSMGSDTDDDEWVIEFTPPNAYFDPAYKGKKIINTDNSTQYTYLDYQVKLLDRYGNPVPRFFRGPDGKQQCSDLGGFWSPDHKWLEINIDGFIAPDGRWAPFLFTGPNGETIDAEDGKFQISNGEWLVIGVDGYVDSQNKWHFYNKSRSPPDKKKPNYRKTGTGMKLGGKHEEKHHTKTEDTFSCFGDASPKYLANMGLVGHGHDRKLLLDTLKHLVSQGENIKIPDKSTVPRSGRKNKTNYVAESRKFLERSQCHHKQSPPKGIVAVDERGHKTYFTLTPHENTRPKERLAAMGDHGISLSSFHVPCLASFINSEVMKQQQYEHILEHNARYMKNVAGQTDKF